MRAGGLDVRISRRQVAMSVHNRPIHSNLQSSHRVAGEGRQGWSDVVGLGCSEERALAFCCGLHDRIGRNSVVIDLDGEIVHMIMLMADARDSILRLQTDKPDAGCTLYGCMFDVRNQLLHKHIVISAITVFSSKVCRDVSYEVFYKHASSCWLHLDSRRDWTRIAVSSASVSDTMHSSGAGGDDSEGLQGFNKTVILLTCPIVLPNVSKASIYVHSDASWGAVGYKAIDMLSPMACPGAVTASAGGLEILTGTFGMAPHAFVDMSTVRCAFSGFLEADVVDGCTGLAVMTQHAMSTHKASSPPPTITSESMWEWTTDDQQYEYF